MSIRIEDRVSDLNIMAMDGNPQENEIMNLKIEILALKKDFKKEILALKKDLIYHLKELDGLKDKLRRNDINWMELK